MKNRRKRVGKITKWLISFLIIYSMVGANLPIEDITSNLNQIEESIENNDWDQAKISMEILKTIYNSNKALVQGSNANDTISTIDYIMGEIDTLIQNEEDSALEYIRGLKDSIQY